MISHSQKNTTKLFQPQSISVLDDPNTKQLDEKIDILTKELEKSYEIHRSNNKDINKERNSPKSMLPSNQMTESNKIQKLKKDSDSTERLKTKLNKLITDNYEKNKFFTGLKAEIESLMRHSFDDTKAISLESSNSSDLYQEKLETELDKIINENELAVKEQNCIKSMLRKEKDTILVLKERLQDLNEAYRKITKSYNQAIYSNKKA